MKSFKAHLAEAGLSAERQETAFVELVNTSVKMNNDTPITLITKDATIKNVLKAEKFEGRQESG